MLALAGKFVVTAAASIAPAVLWAENKLHVRLLVPKLASALRMTSKSFAPAMILALDPGECANQWALQEWQVLGDNN
jgi:hypothetical protein